MQWGVAGGQGGGQRGRAWRQAALTSSFLLCFLKSLGWKREWRVRSDSPSGCPKVIPKGSPVV